MKFLKNIDYNNIDSGIEYLKDVLKENNIFVNMILSSLFGRFSYYYSERPTIVVCLFSGPSTDASRNDSTFIYFGRSPSHIYFSLFVYLNISDYM